jgi:hypothetical protein
MAIYFENDLDKKYREMINTSDKMYRHYVAMQRACSISNQLWPGGRKYCKDIQNAFFNNIIQILNKNSSEIYYLEKEMLDQKRKNRSGMDQI